MCTEIGGTEVTFTDPTGIVYGPVTENFPLQESNLDLPYATELAITTNPATLPAGWVQPPNPLRVTIPEDSADSLSILCHSASGSERRHPGVSSSIGIGIGCAVRPQNLIASKLFAPNRGKVHADVTPSPAFIQPLKSPAS